MSNSPEKSTDPVGAEYQTQTITQNTNYIKYRLSNLDTGLYIESINELSKTEKSSVPKFLGLLKTRTHTDSA